MENHKSSEKRIRSNGAKRERNRYQTKTARTVMRTLRETKDKKQAEKLLVDVTSMLDKLAKTNVIHKNKASNLKSGFTKMVKALK